MELKKITRDTLPLAKELFAAHLAEAKALAAQIKLVEATGADSPDGLTTKSGKKVGKKTAKKADHAEASAEKAGKKAAKKSAKKTGKKEASKKSGKKTGKKEASKKAEVERGDDGKRITLAMRVQSHVAEKFADGTFSPKEVRLGLGLAVNYQVPISQVLKKLTEEGKFSKISRGSYQLNS